MPENHLYTLSFDLHMYPIYLSPASIPARKITSSIKNRKQRRNQRVSFVAHFLKSIDCRSMKSPHLRSLPQEYPSKSILRDTTTYFEDSVFPIREINSML